jgi:hypothetical protein
MIDRAYRKLFITASINCRDILSPLFPLSQFDYKTDQGFSFDLSKIAAM